MDPYLVTMLLTCTALQIPLPVNQPASCHSGHASGQVPMS